MQPHPTTGSSTRRAVLRSVSDDLLRLDLKISRLETVLRQLLDRAGAAEQRPVDNPTSRRVERRRAAC